MKELLSTNINSYKGEIFEKVYPGFTVKSLLKEIRNIYSEICYFSIWNSAPASVEAWRNQKFSSERLAWLSNNCEKSLPNTHGKLAALLCRPSQKIGLEELAQIIIDLRDELYPAIIEANESLGIEGRFI